MLKYKYYRILKSFNLKQTLWPWWTFLVVLWLRLHASTCRGDRSSPSPGTKILHAAWNGKNKQTKTLKSGLLLVTSNIVLMEQINGEFNPLTL